MKEPKKLADRMSMVYKKSSGQVSFTDFGMPLGMQLNPENRWVKKSQTIPWDEIEERYAQMFLSETGNPAKPLQLALGALIIQTERGISDAEVPLQIQETPCLQYFCGFSEYRDELPFDSSLMVHFRKRLTPEILGEINEMIISKATFKEEAPPDDDDADSDGGSPNQGTLIVDSTCAPQNIRYPQDITLLNEARENLEGMIDNLHDPADGDKPRTYRKNARRDYLNIAKRRKKTSKQIRKAIGKQLRYIRRDLRLVDAYLQNGRELSARTLERLETINTLYGQQLEMFEKRTHQVADRIVSLGQPWVRPIVRGKAKAKCEFGAKLDISVSDGFVRLEHTSFDAYNESENLVEIIERYRTRTGHYPERLLADQIYRNRDNIKYCNERGIRLLGKPLGRPPKDYAPDKKLCRTDEIDRIEVERKISHAKGSFGLGLIRTRLKESTKSAIAMSVVVLNLAFIEKIPRTFLRLFLKFFTQLPISSAFAVIQ